MQQQKKKQQINKYEIMLDKGTGPGPESSPGAPGLNFYSWEILPDLKIPVLAKFSVFRRAWPGLYSAYIALYNHYIISVVFNEGLKHNKLPMPQALLAYYSTEKII